MPPVGRRLDGTIQGIAIDGRGFIYASGKFTRTDSTYGLAVWNGTVWSFPPETKGLAGWGPIAAVGNAAYLVFESKPTEIYRYDGTALVSIEAQANAFIFTLEGMGNELIVGGEFTAIGGVAGNHIARFGTHWETMAEGTPMTVRCLAVVDGALLAGGGIGGALITDIPGLIRWDGQKWIAFENLPSNRGYFNIIAGASGRIYAGGFLFPPEGDSSRIVEAFVAWEGSNWKRYGDHVINNDLNALAILNGTVWAGGRFHHPSAPYLGQWDGKIWNPPYALSTQAPSGAISVLNNRGGRMLAAGTFRAVSPDSLTLLSE